MTLNLRVPKRLIDGRVIDGLGHIAKIHVEHSYSYQMLIGRS